MSLPKSKILSVSRGFAAAAEVYNNSPNQTQIVNVNIKSPDNEQSEQAEQTKPAEQVEEPKPQIETVKFVQEANELSLTIKNKENVINAYALLLSIVENNPLIQNKYIIAKGVELAQLIQLLTEADSVEINKSNDVSCSCFNSSVSYSAVEKIYVIKNDETFNFKYSFPQVNKILDEHHISVKFVVD